MLKKRAKASHAQRIVCSTCPKLDTGFEALPNDRGHNRHPFGKGSCRAGIEEGNTAKYKLNCPARPKPYGEDLLETDSERLLKISAAAEIAVFRRLWEFAADQDAWGLFAPKLPQVFSSVEKHADRRISSPSKRR